MELHQLEYLAAVAEEGSISRGAAGGGGPAVAQPAGEEARGRARVTACSTGCRRASSRRRRGGNCSSTPGACWPRSPTPAAASATRRPRYRVAGRRRDPHDRAVPAARRPAAVRRPLARGEAERRRGRDRPAAGGGGAGRTGRGRAEQRGRAGHRPLREDRDRAAAAHAPVDAPARPQGRRETRDRVERRGGGARSSSSRRCTAWPARSPQFCDRNSRHAAAGVHAQGAALDDRVDGGGWAGRVGRARHDGPRRPVARVRSTSAGGRVTDARPVRGVEPASVSHERRPRVRRALAEVAVTLQPREER